MSSSPAVRTSKDNIIIVRVAQHVPRAIITTGIVLLVARPLGRLLLRRHLGVRGGDVPLFLVRDLLESVEFLAVEFVEFGVDVFDGVFGSGYYDVFTIGKVRQEFVYSGTGRGWLHGVDCARGG